MRTAYWVMVAWFVASLIFAGVKGRHKLNAIDIIAIALVWPVWVVMATYKSFTGWIMLW